MPEKKTQAIVEYVWNWNGITLGNESAVKTEIR